MLLSIQIPFTSAKIIYIPNSGKNVTIDGNVDPDEWRDAYHIVFDSLDGGNVDVYMKYDKTKELLLCGFIIDDSTPDPEDIFFLGVDRDNNGGAYPQKTDYLLSIFRESYVLTASFHIDTTLGEGTGSGWELYDDFDANIRYFRSPFKDFVWSRKEVSRSGSVEGQTWSGEFSLYLAKSSATSSGSVNQGLTMGFLIGYEDTQGEGDYKFYFYNIGEVPDTPNTLTPVAPALWSTVYFYAPSSNVWFQEPPTLKRIDMKALEILTNPKVLKLKMYEDPEGTAKLIRDNVREYTLSMAKYLIKSSIWAESLPLTGDLQNEAEIREVLNTLIETQQASLAYILELSNPYQSEPSLGIPSQIIESIQNIFLDITGRGTASIETLQQNANDLRNALLEFDSLGAALVGTGANIFNIDTAVTLSKSNDPEDVLQFDQMITTRARTFDFCYDLLEKIDLMNRELVNLIGR